MKGFIIALAIFLSIIILLFFYSNFIDSTFNLLSLYVSEVEIALKNSDFKKALTNSENLRRTLKNESKILYFLSDRTPIDNAFSECERLISFIRTEDVSEASASAYTIDIILEKTKEKSILFIPQKRAVN